MERGDEILRDPKKLAQFLEAGSPKKLLHDNFQKMVKGVHKNGFRIFTYMDPHMGQMLPKLHRRNRGLGLWKAGLDGTMTGVYGPGYARQHQSGVPLGTLAWEGCREGVDDARYLSTLLQELKNAKVAGRHVDLVNETHTWLDGLTMNTALNAMRREMARRIEALAKR